MARTWKCQLERRRWDDGATHQADGSHGDSSSLVDESQSISTEEIGMGRAVECWMDLSHTWLRQLMLQPHQL